MANTSISGLASGLDTATIINQLMQLEAQPQARLKSALSREQSTLKTLRDLNSQISALATTARSLTGTAAWSPLKATSSSTDVTVLATTGAAGTYELTVTQTARAHQLTFATTALRGDTVVTNGTAVNLTVGGTTRSVETGDGTLAGLVNALNGSGTGVRASTIRLDDGTERLVVSAATTGAAAAFTLTDSTGADLLGGASVLAGRDAAITIGADTVHSATNTFSEALTGVEVTVSAAAVGTSVQVSVDSDADAVEAKVRGLVDAVNGALSTLDRLTSFDPITKTSGALAGESQVTGLRNTLLRAVFPEDGSSLAGFGLQTDRSGKLVLDAAVLRREYAEDPAAVAAALGPAGGFAARVESVATAASASTTGTLTAAITGGATSVKRMEDSIASWDLRLQLRRTTLTRQFTALETALGQMKSQSDWLAGQLSTLNASGS